MITKEKVVEALSYVDDPDLNKDIVSLGMVEDIVIEGKKVSFTVVLTTPACPMKDMIQRACENAILHYVDKEAEVKVHMTAKVKGEGNRLESLSGIQHIIAVASGKGGVGKSTIAANLAKGLQLSGAKVGIIDADIHGPSIPIMFDVSTEKPGMRMVDGKNKMVPVESYGVKIQSIGFFAETSQAVAWRGPMASKALSQLFLDTDWGELDYLIIDLPPGTGDIHLSLVSTIPVNAAVIVSTPQAVALADARKAIAFFGIQNVSIPVLGLVENMAWFTPEELPENKYYLFGKEGTKQLANELGLPLLAQIPIIQSIRESGDAGRPAVMQEQSVIAEAFKELAGKTAQELSILFAKSDLISNNS